MVENTFLVEKKKFRFSRDCFLNHHKSISINGYGNTSYYCGEESIKHDLISFSKSFSEMFEREILVNTNKIKDKTLNAISLYDGATRKIDRDKILFSTHYVDSCGMAAHYDSTFLLEKAYCEFFERQSFFFNYLSKSEGYHINVDTRFLEETSKMNQYLYNYFDEIVYYEISLLPEIFVVLGIATGEQMNAVGLGSSNSLDEAIGKAQKELLSYWAFACNKSNDEKTMNSNTSKLSEYKKEYLRECYEYLEMSKPICNRTVKEEKCDISELITKSYRVYGMNPHIIVFFSYRDIQHLKIAKVFDFNWFPNLNPRTYSEKNYKYVEEHTGKKLIRTISEYPFD